MIAGVMFLIAFVALLAYYVSPWLALGLLVTTAIWGSIFYVELREPFIESPKPLDLLDYDKELACHGRPPRDEDYDEYEAMAGKTRVGIDERDAA